MMGSPSDELGHDYPGYLHINGEDYHHVTLTKAFYIGVFELTQKQFKNLGTLSLDCKFKADTRPVEERSVTSYRGKIDDYSNTELNCVDPNSACGLLSAKSGMFFDLPTIEEWEYACRAGTGTTYYNGDDEANLGDIAWYSGNAGGETHPVGTREPNNWGLYDMLGNVSEWTRSGSPMIDMDADRKNKAVVDPSTALPSPTDPNVKNAVWIRGGSILRNASDVTSFWQINAKWSTTSFYSYNSLIGARLRASAIITY